MRQKLKITPVQGSKSTWESETWAELTLFDGGPENYKSSAGVFKMLHWALSSLTTKSTHKNLVKEMTNGQNYEFSRAKVQLQ